MYRLVTLFLVVAPGFLLSQSLSVEPIFFSPRNSNDSVAAERCSFRVPVDWSAPTSDSLDLYFVRFSCTGENAGTPIVYLAGGPGGSGTGTASGNRFPLFMKLREVADVIVFDQRGTGLSNVLPDCPYRASFPVDSALDRDDYVRGTTANIRRCLAFYDSSGYDLRHYNTDASAYDLNALRRALGEEQLSLWGISYGSHLAFAYIRLFEQYTDRVVLAALEGPDETVKLPADTERFVRELATRAATNYGHQPVYPNLLEQMQTVHARLKKSPVRAEFTNRRGQPTSVTISNVDLQLLIATNYLRDPEDSAQLPRLYQRLYAGDFSEVAEIVWIFKKYVLPGFRPMAFAMDQMSGMSSARKRLVDSQRNTTLLGSTINFLLPEWMEEVDFPSLPADFRRLPPNNVDALLFSGLLDGRTYYWSGQAIAQSFKNGHHVLVDNAGHNLYMTSPVISDMVWRFFQGKELRINRITLDPTPFE